MSRSQAVKRGRMCAVKSPLSKVHGGRSTDDVDCSPGLPCPMFAVSYGTQHSHKSSTMNGSGNHGGLPRPVITCTLPEYNDQQICFLIQQYLKANFPNTAGVFTMELGQQGRVVERAFPEFSKVMMALLAPFVLRGWRAHYLGPPAGRFEQPHALLGYLYHYGTTNGAHGVVSNDGSTSRFKALGRSDPGWLL